MVLMKKWGIPCDGVTPSADELLQYRQLSASPLLDAFVEAMSELVASSQSAPAPEKVVSEPLTAV